MESSSSLSSLLEQWDKTATLAINSLHSPFTDPIWQFFSDKLVWIPFYLILVVMLFRVLGWKKALLAVVACGLTVAACDQLANFTKAYFERFRPSWDEYMLANGLHLLESKGSRYGFYSAHAANAMGIAICSIISFRQSKRGKYLPYTWGVVIWAMLVGVSRIFAGKHFLGDVCVGLAVGLLFGFLIGKLAAFVMAKVRWFSTGTL